jgi:RNA polymerase sigma-70 factor (ECF subfamily)
MADGFRRNRPTGVIPDEGAARPEASVVNDEKRSTRTAPSDLTPSLVASLRSGDARAGVLLNRLYRERLIRFCWGYLGSVEEAEDAVQEVFCKVLASSQIPHRFRPWLYKIARNHCLNLARRRARRKDRRDLPSDSQLEARLTGNLTGLVKREMRSRLMHLLAALPTAYREVLRLRYAEELSRAEIAEVLDTPKSVVKSRLFEGLKKLREHSSLLEEP